MGVYLIRYRGGAYLEFNRDSKDTPNTCEMRRRVEMRGSFCPFSKREICAPASGPFHPIECASASCVTFLASRALRMFAPMRLGFTMVCGINWFLGCLALLVKRKLVGRLVRGCVHPTFLRSRKRVSHLWQTPRCRLRAARHRCQEIRA